MHALILAAGRNCAPNNDLTRLPYNNISVHSHEMSVYCIVGEIASQAEETFSLVSGHYNQGRMIVNAYVGMARKQDGGSNGCISNYTVITQLGAGVACF